MGEGPPRATRKALTLVLPLAALAGMLYVAWREQERVSALTAQTSTEAATPAKPSAAAAPATDAPKMAGAASSAVESTMPKEPPVVEPVAAPEPTAEQPAVAKADVPGFDVVRVEPDGSAAVAGTAEPGSSVTIYADQAPIAVAEADKEGNFVAVFKVAPSVAPRALTLGAVPQGGGEAASSDDVVMLLPKAPVAPEVETPAPAAPPVVGRHLVGGPMPRPDATTAAVKVAATATAAKAAAPEVAVTAIVRGDAVEVLPAAGGKKALALASISYTDAGGVTLAGVGAAGSMLRAYVDDSFAQEATVGADGRWSMDLGGVAEGLYKLRIDQLGSDGKVARRVETPFQRDYPHAPPPRPGQPPSPIGTVTVQPGNNLWTLARERYGSGVMYTQIFTANREQIRNPDLIYPGQIFNVPDSAAASVE